MCPFVRNTRPGFLGRILSLSAAVASIRKRREASTTRSEFLQRKKKTQRTFPFSCTPFLPAKKKHSNFGAEKLLLFFLLLRAGKLTLLFFRPKSSFFCFAAVSLRQIFFSSSRQQEGSGKKRKMTQARFPHKKKTGEKKDGEERERPPQPLSPSF